MTQIETLQRALATLKSNSSSMSAVSLDARKRMLAYGLLTKAGATGVDMDWLNQIASCFQGWNPDNQLNGVLYSLAANNSLPTNGPAFQRLVDNGIGYTGPLVFSGWSRTAGIVDAQTVTGILQYAELVLAGAPFPVQSIIS